MGDKVQNTLWPGRSYTVGGAAQYVEHCESAKGRSKAGQIALVPGEVGPLPHKIHVQILGA
jgi:hypothetical protein